MRKTARPVVWEGDGAQSPSLDPISDHHQPMVRAIELDGLVEMVHQIEAVLGQEREDGVERAPAGGARERSGR